ncbi:MAG TPA: glycosyltransferase family 2 protein [Kiloniellales bacterium]|nr:glycosyltransferase family 2 protein [Kiloniellales bacterium]
MQSEWLDPGQAPHAQELRAAAGGSLWAQHQLGMYGSVVGQLTEDVRRTSWRSLLAAAASSAALGRHAEARHFVSELERHPLARWRHRRRVATGLALHAPALALHWLEQTHRRGEKDACLDVWVALLCGLQRYGQAALALPQALHDCPEQPELLLHQANLLRLGKLKSHPNTEEAAHASLTRYFERFGLEQPHRIDTSQPFSARNATATASPAQGARPLVSVIMTAHETADRIESALRSLLAQTHQDLEILVMDDASADDLGSVVTLLQQKDPRVSYFRLPRNVGTYVAKELALRHLVRGDFVTCHDSDDWSHPRKIELQLDELLQQPERVFSWSYWLRLQDDGLIVARQSHPLLRSNLSSVLFRRDPVLNRAGGYDQVRTGADSEFLARLQLVFGQKASARVRKPLAFGAARAGSLMTDQVTGITGVTSTTPFRLAYWEAWRRWHMESLKQGRRPRMPEKPLQRPFPIPEGQAAAPGPDLLEAIWRQVNG